MNRKDYFDNYISTQFSAVNPMTSDAHKERYEYYDVNYSSLLPSDREGALLDIGCGTGSFISYLKEKGYRHTFGIDISKEMIDWCSAHVSDKVLLVDDARIFLEGKRSSYDVIVMNDVIEHFPKSEIVPLLQAVRGALTQKGIVIINTINAASVVGNYNELRDFTHETGFTEFNLAQVLRLASFSSDITVLESKPYVVNSVRRFLRISARRMLHYLWKFIFYIEYTTLPRILTDRIIVVAKKSHE